MTIPDCSTVVKGELRCDWVDWKNLVTKVVNTPCLAPSLLPFAQSLEGNSSSSDFFHSLLFLLAILIGVCLYYTVTQKPSTLDYTELASSESISL